MIDLKTFGKKGSEAVRQQIEVSIRNFGKKTEVGHANPDFQTVFKASGKYLNSSKKDRLPTVEIPVEFHSAVNFEEQPSAPLKYMWLGHASVLIELGGKRILIDPVFSERPSPTDIMGPSKRFHPAPLDPKDLPNIDFILISHNHYDHLDYNFIKQYDQTNTQFVLPLGLGETFKYWGIPEYKIIELDWHQHIEIEDFEFTALPARHYSGRSLTDRNSTFWNGYLIQYKATKVFVSGDSGFMNKYKLLGEQYGPVDLCIQAIGAYNKLWHYNHTFPEEAWQVHKLMQSKYMLPVHWATFDLAFHPWAEPIEALYEAAEDEQDQIIMPHPGQWVSSSEGHESRRWWLAD